MIVISPSCVTQIPTFMCNLDLQMKNLFDTFCINMYKIIFIYNHFVRQVNILTAIVVIIYPLTFDFSVVFQNFAMIVMMAGRI